MFDLLLIEDNPSHARLIERLLEKDKFAVFHATELHEASDELSRRSFDALIVDLHLPDSWASDTFDRLEPYVQSIPMIAISSGRHEIELLGKRHPGAQALLVKGEFDTARLSETVEKVIESWRALHAPNSEDEPSPW